ncbi:uncharacterized protein LOC107500408 isoform X3 [Rousettus aegyptiacus]|uniref:uncharacterized protein LOC107500408 isoform X3 n=1 Tax=Rousettus aegyptiacus TaxID=9407 RepID=UPI00168D464B|nr:uncharacterized protein LOC107500408 isoform X3 [Rousettus aegyptiacus]
MDQTRRSSPGGAALDVVGFTTCWTRQRTSKAAAAPLERNATETPRTFDGRSQERRPEAVAVEGRKLGPKAAAAGPGEK